MKDFRPINPHGSKAELPDRKFTPVMEPLYQVHVETPEGYVPVGPKCGRSMAERFMIAVNRNIAKGKGDWSNPTLVPMRSV